MRLDVIIDDRHVIPDYIRNMPQEEIIAKIEAFHKKEQKKRLSREKRYARRAPRPTV
jgi:hypothetical protein